jgi:hypothetical protein
MEDESSVLTEEMVLSAIEDEGDGVPRWRSLVVAGWLGYGRPRNIRNIILRNQAQLDTHGPLISHRFAVERSQGGGTEGEEFLLNEEHVYLVCMWSDTPRAKHVQSVIARVMRALRAGELVPAQNTPPPWALTLFRAVFDNLHQFIDDRTRDMCIAFGHDRKRLDRIESALAVLPASVTRALNECRRRDFDAETKRVRTAVLILHFNGRCPMCGKVVIDELGRFIAEDDHWNGNNHDNRPANCTPFCKDCHIDKHRSDDDVFQRDIAHAHDYFHQKRRQFLKQQATEATERRVLEDQQRSFGW